MSQELHYTSSPRGLKAGSRGFCTVACTAGLSSTWAERLEALSGYRPKYPPHHPEAALNPVNCSHLRLSAIGQTASVLSRVGPAGLDYTDRPNKYAHHVVLESGERAAGGPAWMLAQAGFMEAAWTSSPQVLATGRRPPVGDRPVAVCRVWAECVGDAGWAGVVAESFLSDPRRPAIFVYEPGVDVLGLFVEALALLPADRRWEVTFSTFFTGLPAGMTCAWRGVLRDSPEERQARANPEALILDLGQSLGTARGGVLVNAARTGEAVDTVPSPSALPREVPVPASRAAALPLTVQTEPPLEPAPEYSMAPPPLVSRTRGRSTAVKASHPRRTVWPIAAAVAAAFLVGGALGGVGVAVLLGRSAGDRNVSLAPNVANKKATAEKSDSAATKGTQRSTENVVATGPQEKMVPKDASASVSPLDLKKQVPSGESGKEPDAKAVAEKPIYDVPSPSRTQGTAQKSAVAPKGAAEPKPENVQASNEPEPGNPSASVGGAATQAPTPAVPTPIPIKFASIPEGIPDSLIGDKNRGWLLAEKPVRLLTLIGLKSRANVPYHFKEKRLENKNELRITSDVEDRENVEIGYFKWKENRIDFSWLPVFAQGGVAQKNAVRDCVLDVEFKGGGHERYLLRNPRPNQLPDKLKSLSDKKTYVENDEQVVVSFEWYDPKSEENRGAETNLRPRLYSLNFFRSDGSSVELMRKGHAPSELESADQYVTAMLAGANREKLQITIKKPSEMKIKKIKNERAASGGGQRRQGEAPDTGGEDEQDRVEEEIRELEGRFKLGNSILGASMRALVTVEVEGQEFSFPELLSKGGEQ